MSNNYIYLVYLRCPELKEMCWVGSAFSTYEDALASVKAQTHYDDANNFTYTQYKIAEVPMGMTIFTNDNPKKCPVALK